MNQIRDGIGWNSEKQFSRYFVVLEELGVENKSAKPNLFKEVRHGPELNNILSPLSFLLSALGIASFREDGLADRMEAQENEHTATAWRKTQYSKE